MIRNRKHILAGGIVLAFVVIAAVLVWPAVRAGGGEAGGNDGDGAVAWAWDIHPSAETLGADVDRVGGVVRDVAGGMEGARLSAERVESLGAAVERSLEVYLSGSMDRFEAELQALGLPFPRNWDDDSFRTRDWEDRSATLRWAPIASEGIDVRPRFIEGEAIAHPEQAQVNTVSRPDRTEHLGSPAGDDLTIVEVVIPMQVRTHTGRTFAGRAGFWYAWNRTDKRWDLHRIQIYDNPTKDFVIMPLL